MTLSKPYGILTHSGINRKITVLYKSIPRSFTSVKLILARIEQQFNYDNTTETYIPSTIHQVSKTHYQKNKKIIQSFIGKANPIFKKLN